MRLPQAQSDPDEGWVAQVCKCLADMKATTTTAGNITLGTVRIAF
jgi:hypothetical protein